LEDLNEKDNESMNEINEDYINLNEDNNILEYNSNENNSNKR
jgi:hypothetical protein